MMLDNDKGYNTKLTHDVVGLENHQCDDCDIHGGCTTCDYVSPGDIVDFLNDHIPILVNDILDAVWEKDNEEPLRDLLEREILKYFKDNVC